MSAGRAPESARWMLLISVGLTVLLYVVPYGHVLAYPFVLLSTVAHEMGHGLTALVTGAAFERFTMWRDGSGVAVWSGSVGRLGLALIAAGGLVGPAVAAAIGFAAGRSRNGAHRFLLGVGGGLVLALLLVVRGWFAWLFVGLVAATCLWVGIKGRGEVAQLVLVFLSVQLALSVFSRSDYLFTPVAVTAQGTLPSDVGQISAALVLPYWFWGGLCGALSVLALLYGLRAYWR